MRSSVLQGHRTTITSSFLILCNLSLDRWLQREARNVTCSTPYHGLVIYLSASHTLLSERWKTNENGKEISVLKTQWAPPENLLCWSARVTPEGENHLVAIIHWLGNHRKQGVLPAGLLQHRLWDRQAENIVNAIGWSQSIAQQPPKGTAPLQVPDAPFLPIRSHAFMWRSHTAENQPWGGGGFMSASTSKRENKNTQAAAEKGACLSGLQGWRFAYFVQMYPLTAPVELP